jgi:cyclase
MIKKRLIPKLLISRDSNGNLVVVTTKKFSARCMVGDPVSQARIYQHQAVDELVFLNIDDPKDFPVAAFAKLAERISEEIFMPVTFGGGISTKQDIRLLLRSGADKVSLNHTALKEPHKVREFSDIFGAQCVVISIDYIKNSDGQYRVVTDGGRKILDLNPVEWAVKAQGLGAGEILITSVDHDGMRQGLCIDLIKQVTEAVSIPVVVGGGCGLARHFIEGFLDGGADAICAGSYFAFKDENPMQCRSQIFNAGVAIRRLT